MRWVELLGEGLLFAALVTLAYRLRRRHGALVLAAGWVAALSAYILATLPGPQVPVHDFERNPVPALLAVLGGTVAATAFTVIQRQDRPLPAQWLVAAGVYLLVSLLVGIPAALISLG